MKHYRLLIGGEDVDAANGETFESLNPTTGRPWATLALGGTQDVDRAVRAAGAAFESEAWRALSPTRRGRLLMRLADLIADRAEEIARIEVADNGKLYKEMRAQLRVIPDWLYYFGGLADKVEGRVIPLDRTSVLNYTLREPLGIVGIIVPWNSPVLLDDVLALPGARSRQHRRRQAFRARIGEHPGDAPARGRGRLPAGRRQRRHRHRRCGRGARRAPGRREDLVHGKRDDRQDDRRGRRRPARRDDDGARRQEPEHRLRRRPRRSGRGRPARRDLRRGGADVRGRIPRPPAATRL